ncbi:MAG: hypothetical protein QM676_11510 [Novosphingobium sp.]
MPPPTQRGRKKPRVRRPDRRAAQPDAAPAELRALAQNWRTIFFESLAATSNVTQSCARAGVSTSTIYDLKRRDHGFSMRWMEALAEGYDNLEMELLNRLRNGDTGEARYNYAVSMRALQAHRDAVNAERGRRASVDSAEVRASIHRKLAELRDRVRARRNGGDGNERTGDDRS